MAKERKSEELSRTSSISRAFSRRGKKDKDDKKRLSGLFSRSRESVNLTSSPRASIDKKSSELKKQVEKAEDEVKEVKLAAVKEAKEKTEPIEAGVTSVVDGAKNTVDTPEITKDLDTPLAAAEQPEPTNLSSEPEILKPIEASPIPEIPIPATSTPIEVGQSLTPTTKVPPIPIADERQPLLPQEHVPSPVYSFLSSPNVSIGLILLVIIVIIVFFFVYHAYNVDVQNSLVPELQAIYLIGITGVGLQVKVDCSVAIDYQLVSNIIFRNLYRFVGLLMGTVIIKPYNPIGVTVNKLDSFNITVPEFPLLLVDKSLNLLEFETIVDVNDSNMILLLNDLVNKKRVVVNLRSLFYTAVHARGVTIPHLKLDIDQDVIFNNNVSSAINLQNTVIELQGDSIMMNSDISYLTYYMKDFLEVFNEYRLMLNCTEWQEIGTAVVKTYDNYFNVEVEVSDITTPEPECVSDFLQQYANGESKLFLNGKPTSGIHWLDHIISNVYVKTPILLKSLPLTLDGSSMNESLIQLEVGDDYISGEISKPINLTTTIDMELEIRFPQSELIESKGIVSDRIFTGSFLMKNPNITELVNHSKLNVDILLKKVILNHLIEVENLLFNDTPVTIKDIDIHQINPAITASTIVVTSVSPESIDLRVVVSLDLENIKLTVKQPILADIISNSTHIGTLSTKQFTMDDSQIDLTVYKGEGLQQFLNNFISGVEQNITTQLTQGMLEGVDIQDISIPKLEFVEEGITYDKFVVSSTIHILKSEVELEILNPISNHEIIIDLKQINATFEGNIIGELSKPQRIMVPSGVNKVDKIPIKLNGIGADVLRKALNGNIKVTVVALFDMEIEEFAMEITYKGTELPTDIRW